MLLFYVVFLSQNINIIRWCSKPLASQGEWVYLLSSLIGEGNDRSGALRNGAGESRQGQEAKSIPLRFSWSFQNSERLYPTWSCPPYLEEKTPEAMPTARIPGTEQWSWADRSCWSFLSGETQGSPLATHFPTSSSLFAITSMPASHPLTADHHILPSAFQEQSQPYKLNLKKKSWRIWNVWPRAPKFS